MKMKYILRNKSRFDRDLIIASTELFRFSHLSIQLLASTFIHFFLFSRFFSFSFTQRVCTLTYRTVYRNVFICVAGKKERTFMYTYIFSYVFPLKTPRTIGSMLNVSFFYMYNVQWVFFLLFIIYVISIRIRCARLASFRLRIIFSISLPFFYLFYHPSFKCTFETTVKFSRV